jgi:hypothetical protein
MNGRAWWRRILKALHEIAAIGLGGGLATCLVIGMTANVASHAEFVAARLAIAAVARYVLMPSLALVLVTGMLAMLATRAFKDAGWAWLKAILGLSVFEATLITIGASTSQAALAQVGTDPGLLMSLMQSERNTLWMLLGLSIANVVLAVWRPRLMVKIR